MNAAGWGHLAVVGGALLVAGAPLPAEAVSSAPARLAAVPPVPPPAAAGLTSPSDRMGRVAIAWPSLTQLTVTPNPARAGGLVTLSGRVTSDTIPVTLGTVTFAEFGGSRIAVPLGPDGTAALSYGFDDPGSTRSPPPSTAPPSSPPAATPPTSAWTRSPRPVTRAPSSSRRAARSV